MNITLVNIVLAVLGTVILYVLYRVFVDFKKAVFIAHKLTSWINVEALIKEVSSTFETDIEIETELICHTINKLTTAGRVIVRLNADGQSIINEAKSKFGVQTDKDLMRITSESFEKELKKSRQKTITTRQQLNETLKRLDYLILIIMLLSPYAHSLSAPYLEARLTYGGPSRDKKFFFKSKTLSHATASA